MTTIDEIYEKVTKAFQPNTHTREDLTLIADEAYNSMMLFMKNPSGNPNPDTALKWSTLPHLIIKLWVLCGADKDRQPQIKFFES